MLPAARGGGVDLGHHADRAGLVQQQLACQNVPFEALYSRPLRAGTYDVKLAGAVIANETAVVIRANNAVTELSYIDP